MSTTHHIATVALAEPSVTTALTAACEAPTSPLDSQSFAAQYLHQAKVDSALARWENYCPLLLKTSDWDHPSLLLNRPQIDKILAWQYNPKGLLASGYTGKGKSRALWALLRRLAAAGHDIGYYTAADWFSSLQSRVNYGRDEAAGWVAAVARRPIVFIDDLGQEAITTAREDWCASWFFQFLDQRHGHCLPLFVSTNLSADQIAGTGDRAAIRGNPLVRRLMELCEVVKFSQN